jgi:hypothetical protein
MTTMITSTVMSASRTNAMFASSSFCWLERMQSRRRAAKCSAHT